MVAADKVTLTRAQGYTDNKINQAKDDTQRYTDNEISQAKNDTQRYTDSKISQAKNDTKRYTDQQISTAQGAAHDYTDRVHQSINRDMVAAGKVTLTRAQGYTDNKINQVKNDTKHYTDQQISTAQGAAHDYTDRVHQSINRDMIAAGKVTLTRAQGYTDNKINQAKDDTKRYTDQQISTAQGAAHDYTDRVHQSINRDMVAADNVTLTRAQGYTDNKINQVKNDTRRYTDNEISQAKNDTQRYTDQQISTAQGAAHDYTDRVHQSINRDMVAAGKVTLTRAQGYTDNKINQAKNDTRRYTDNKISQVKNDTKHYTDQQITTAQGVAHNYTDRVHQSINRDMVAASKVTLTRAQGYTDNKINQAKDDTKRYTDQQISTAQGAAHDYTDRVHQSINRDMVAAGKVTLTRAQGYTDNKINQVKNDTRRYTDNEISQAKNDTKRYTDQQISTAQGAAHDYTDRVHQSINRDMVAAGKVTLTRAQGYTDNKINQVKNDTQRYTDQQISTAQGAAHDYTDRVHQSINRDMVAADKVTLTRAQGYTDNEISQAKNDTQRYTDQQISTAQGAAHDYTDRVHQSINRDMVAAGKVTLTRAQGYTDNKINQVKNDTQRYTDQQISTAQGAAHDYTDRVHQSINRDMVAAGKVTLTRAQGYTDNKINQVKNDTRRYTDNEISQAKNDTKRYTDQQISTAQGAAHNYTDRVHQSINRDMVAAGKVTLTRAQGYTDNKINQVKNDTQRYTDQQISTAQGAAHDYTDRVHQSINRDMVSAGKVTLTRAQGYTDNKINQVKNDTKNYTDNEISQAKNDTQRYTDQQISTAQGAAHDYTDRVHQSINRDMVAAGKVTLTRAQGYTDNKINQVKNDTRRYTDNEISQAKNDTKHYTDQQISTAQGAAHDYTDRVHQSINRDMVAAGKVTLTRAQGYTDNKINQVKNDTRRYTDNEISQAKNDTKHYTDLGDQLTLTQANHYTDGKIADAHDNVKKYSEQLNQAESSARLYADQAEVAARNEGDQKEQAARLDGDQKEQRARAQADYAETIARDNGDKKTLASANRYTDEKINHTESRLNAGIAGVTAISSIPYVHGNTFSYGVGIGNYRNGNAAALGMQYKITNNINARLNASWDSAHNAALGFGLAAGW
ncbi:YadA C-terminal domain-containing protein [Edwardsiella tarda]|uniref:YadA C-terminal domain-containing protein n=1 Tax=Edwardsiella tarda TaxID=636 RepID=UPI003F65E590